MAQNIYAVFSVTDISNVSGGAGGRSYRVNLVEGHHAGVPSRASARGRYLTGADRLGLAPEDAVNVRLGETAIDRIYYGETGVTAMYLGENQIY